ncbi:TolC family outer membrane protein [Rhodomicrobium sp. Az07]|uniref:TolC family outer membrane protein n=1 Tax=Rhodomicrobium sp. Az07 TaxID=2839034 RepID=UPI002037515E|nr:TolC family outer membrane protein [Rhodomicrobium sp. Az07]
MPFRSLSFSGFFRASRTLCSALALSIALGGPVSAETLKEALTAAYLYNPTLKAARSQLRSTDNQVARAKSGYRPRVNATLQAGRADTRTRYDNTNIGGEVALAACESTTSCENPSPLAFSTFNNQQGSNGVYSPRTAKVAVQQNLFDGFRTYNNVKGAEAAVEAGREEVRNAEQTMLLNAVTAYMDVVRDQAIVNLRQSNVRVLAEQLRATEDRFRVGEVTRTDVAQAQSGLAQSQADLSIAQGTLYGDQARFAQYIGHPPGTLRDPGPATGLLPKTLDEAIAIGRSENPQIIAAIFRERAQQHQVKTVKGELLPNLSVEASYTKGVQTQSPLINQYDDARVIGTLNIPIYEGGEVSARIRAEIETLSQRRQQIDEAREITRQQVSSAWGLLIAAKGNVAAGEAAVEATRIALQGVREEERVGQRTLLDVLNSEQQNLNAQVNLVSFRRDLVVASYSVLSGMGRLTASDISLQAELYDPTRYYSQVKDAWYGWGASIESQEDPRVAPVEDPGLLPGQDSGDGPAYTQKLPQIP